MSAPIYCIEDTDEEVSSGSNEIPDKVILKSPKQIIFTDDESSETAESNTEVKKTHLPTFYRDRKQTENVKTELNAGVNYPSKFYRDRKKAETVKYSSCFPEHWFHCTADKSMSPHKKDKSKDVALEVFKRKIHYLGVKHYPVRCPVDVCNEAFDPDELLSHIFYKHTTDKVIRRYGIKEIRNKQTVIMHFKDSDLEPTRAICIGCLLYESDFKKTTVISPDRPFCNGNTFLHDKYVKYKNHVPIMIMANFTTWSALLLSKPLKEKCKADTVQDPMLLMVVIWLAGTKINKPFHVCLTLYNSNMLHSKSAILKVRPIYEAQKPCNFLRNHINYMLLSKGELDLLSNYGRTNIKIEFTPNEEEVN